MRRKRFCGDLEIREAGLCFFGTNLLLLFPLTVYECNDSLDAELFSRNYLMIREIVMN